ncbi:presenilin-like protein At1g08700 [Camellia sinensis]|uniref:presenilin-like protein At1g08700 n=1 Tax=Camellia sinensis TaxID=4442 RepID=UPI001035D98E|nr:presenilin-like protein At1g08700 [Camellia sinensis]
MDGSILESTGLEIIGVMAPVSICMLLVVLLVYSLFSSSSALIRTAANLVYLETPSDSATQTLDGTLLNALVFVFVIIISIITFLPVLLYYYNFTNFLKNYIRFSTFFVLIAMGCSIFHSIIQHFSILIDSILVLSYFSISLLWVFSRAVPIFLKQGFMVALGIIVAAWFTNLPEWTTWAVLIALSLYDLVVVLAPGGLLKILVELASSRDEELPALVYEARPTVVGGFFYSGSVELQIVPRNNESDLDNSDYTTVAIRKQSEVGIGG